MNKIMNRISPQFDLKNKVAIVTGASKGIGESIARGLAEFGAKVVISSRKQEAVDSVAATFIADGLEAVGIACHMGEAKEIENLVTETIDKFGRIDIVINNAATNPVFAPMEKMEDWVFEKVMSVNVNGPLLLCKKALPHLKKQGGSIINISSIEGLKPSFGLSLYSVSKAALISLTQNMAKEWGQYGIRANVVCPGLIQTKFSASLWKNKAMLQQLEQHLPLGRMGQPDEMAGIVLFLASDAAAYCTGAVFVADGGQMLV
jgi:dehydrogenase/reductase SDR family protein 4